jgi:hypothetical protein
VSSAAPPATAGGPSAGALSGEPAAERCPLCGAQLRREQEWCLKCGAAARTRLAAAPNWRAPLVTLAVIGVLALGVLAAALVKLAGDSGPAPAPRTLTVTRPVPAASAPAAALPATSAIPTTAQPGASTAAPGAVTTTTPRGSTRSRRTRRSIGAAKRAKRKGLLGR